MQSTLRSNEIKQGDKLYVSLSPDAPIYIAAFVLSRGFPSRDRFEFLFRSLWTICVSSDPHSLDLMDRINACANPLVVDEHVYS
jgi:hypothetical protein